MNSQPVSVLISPPSGGFIIARQSLPRQDAVKLSLVLPTYNEANNIASMVALLTQQLEPVMPGNYELIVVDDDSPDLTWQVAQTLQADYPQLRVMRRTTEKGLSTAVIRGWQVAQGEILGVIDD